jgi:hypothetical protein
MGGMKEKITLKYRGSGYIVQALENRIRPGVGVTLSPGQVEDLLLEAKRNHNLTVKIT